eukprot:IDg5003t1
MASARATLLEGDIWATGWDTQKRTGTSERRNGWEKRRERIQILYGMH